MAEQPELDLGAPAGSTVGPPRRRHGFGGFSRPQIVIGTLLLSMLVWAMWVTRAITAPKEEHLVSARLSALVGEYVEAQRFSGSPPDRVQSEMRAFMASLDKELQRRGAGGQVVLVGEAVLTKNVPDITDSLKKSVFASGVPVPQRMSPEQLRHVQELSAAQAAMSATLPPPSSDQRMPIALAPAAPPPDGGTATSLSQPLAPVRPGVSVSTFGGPDDNGRH